MPVTLFILGIFLVALAVPPAVNENSWRRFGIALALCFVGVMLPVLVFLLSAFLTPEWKGACKRGWLDCFHLGKLALAPLVLWATAAWYAVEVLRVKERTGPLLVTGLWNGTIVAGACFAFGVGVLGTKAPRGGELLWLFVPLYVAVWQGVRALQVSREAKLSPIQYLLAALGAAPFWWFSLTWSRRIYEGLPDQPPSCFVVTAAARGHEALVGPFLTVSHQGQLRRANRQLLTLWQFEALWQARARRSQAAFRRVYNRIGPVIARQITLPCLADLAYLCLKPMELFAAMTLRIASTKPLPGGTRTALRPGPPGDARHSTQETT